MRVHSQRVSKTTAILGALCMAVATLWSSVGKAETVGHLAWKSTVANIIKDRKAGKSGGLVLIGHSQGANNVIEMARILEKEGIAVDLLVTLAPLLQDPIPGNVV